MYFVDLQAAYDSVDRELFWQVLARVGVPDDIIAVIRHFMTARRPACASTTGISRSSSMSNRDFVKTVCCHRCSATTSSQRHSSWSSCDSVKTTASSMAWYTSRRTQEGGDTTETRTESGVENIIYQRHFRRFDINRRLAKIMTVIVDVFGAFGLTSVGQDGESLDFDTGGTTDEGRSTVDTNPTSPATSDRSGGPDVRIHC